MSPALERVPALEKVGIRQFINGPESFTPDGNFILGEATEVKNFFIGAGFNAFGIASAGGAGKALAESGLALGSKTKRLTSKLEKNELLSFMNEYLGDKNTKFYLRKGYLPSTLDWTERPVDEFRKRANERYQQFLNEGFSTNKNRILWGNRPPKTVEGK